MRWPQAATAFYCLRDSVMDRCRGPRIGPQLCIVPTRYGGGYEGGLFAALEVDDLSSEAFGQDCAASDWWHYNRHRVGVGPTPNDALLDWLAKHPEQELL